MSSDKRESTEFLKESVTDELEIIDIFRTLHRKKEKLWLWQENKENPNQRSIHLCTIRKVDVLAKLIWLNPLNQSKFHFNLDEQRKDSDFFLYSKAKNMAVRFQARERDSEYMSFSTPKKINALSDDFSQKLNLIEKENEREHIHERQLPRKEAKGKQTIQALLANELQPKAYELYDISAGGLAIKWQDPGYFKKGDQIKILSINGAALKQPIQGEVVSIREMNDEIFKIGVQFIKGES